MTDITDETIRGINARLATTPDSEKRFSLSETRSVTLLANRGGYTRLPFAAGDTFMLDHVYRGKTGLVMVCHCDKATAARAAGPWSGEYKQAEFKLADAQGGLDGFDAFWQRLVGEQFTIGLPSDAGDADPEEIERARAEDLTWGSW